MNHYETVFILNPVLSEDQVKEAVEKYGSATSGSSLADILGTALKKKEDK